MNHATVSLLESASPFERAIMSKYPLVQQFLEARTFGASHAARNLDPTDPIVPALEYFPSLRNVSGHAAKLCEILTKPVGSLAKNDRRIQWASLCAEIGAVCLLGKTLGIQILGLEEVSPGAARPNATCDIVASVNNETTFFEVKRNAAEDKQTLPDLLEEKLRNLESSLPFNMTPQLVDRGYDCSDLDERLRQIESHVAAFVKRSEEGRLPGQDAPSRFEDEAFTITFYPKSEGVVGCHFFSPVWSSALSKYLLGPGDEGADGKPMVPMVPQAILKGADYLMCRVTNWKDWPEIVEHCFQEFTHTGGVTYFADDLRLGALNGIVLFARYDDFCIINNLRARARNWLRA